MEVLAALLPIIIIFGTTLLPIWAVLDVVRSNRSSNDKLLWVVIVLFFPIFGSLIYILAGRKK